MKRKKRSYVLILVASVILSLASAYFVPTVVHMFSYKKTDAVIDSVTTQEREGGTYDDRYYYTESDIKCSYTVKNKEYWVTFTIKSNYEGMEGETVAVWYDKDNPRKCYMQAKSVVGLVYSGIFIFACLFMIIADLKGWKKTRIEENQKLLQITHSRIEIQQFEAQKKKQKKINTILIIASGILAIPLLLFFDIPLAVFTTARVQDYKWCYKNVPLKNNSEYSGSDESGIYIYR
ncbi:MAG: DUF3592 domain-containing protein [Butyrivibrio sp.]